MEPAGESALEGGGGTTSVCHLYRAVVHTVPLFGEENWVLSEAMSRNMEGVQVGFLRRITGRRAMQQEDGKYRKVEAEKLLKKAGTQSLGTYIERRQEKVAGWVASRPILEVCDREKDYEGGGSRREPWWRQTVTIKQLVATLKDILATARDRRWKSVRSGRGGGDRDVEESEYGSGRNGSWDARTDTSDAQVGE